MLPFSQSFPFANLHHHKFLLNLFLLIPLKEFYAKFSQGAFRDTLTSRLTQARAQQWPIFSPLLPLFYTRTGRVNVWPLRRCVPTGLAPCPTQHHGYRL